MEMPFFLAENINFGIISKYWMNEALKKWTSFFLFCPLMLYLYVKLCMID